jgi:hypothetical protein
MVQGPKNGRASGRLLGPATSPDGTGEMSEQRWRRPGSAHPGAPARTNDTGGASAPIRDGKTLCPATCGRAFHGGNGRRTPSGGWVRGSQPVTRTLNPGTGWNGPSPQERTRQRPALAGVFRSGWHGGPCGVEPSHHQHQGTQWEKESRPSPDIRIKSRRAAAVPDTGPLRGALIFR